MAFKRRYGPFGMSNVQVLLFCWAVFIFFCFIYSTLFILLGGWTDMFVMIRFVWIWYVVGLED